MQPTDLTQMIGEEMTIGRALAILENPSAYSTEELTKARKTVDDSTTLDLLEEAYKPDAQEIKEWREAGYPGLRKPPSFA